MGYQQPFQNGQTLVSSALSVDEMNNIFSVVTCAAFGILNYQPYPVHLTQGNPNVDVGDATNLQVGYLVTDIPLLNSFYYGDSIYGGGGYGTLVSSIPTDTTIEAINGSIITLSEAPTATVDGIIYISNPLCGLMVRQSWPVEGAPSYKIDENLAFLRCNEVPNWYDTVPDEGTGVTLDAETGTLQREYTRVWRVFWEIRGPIAYTRATLIKTAMQLDFIRDMLAPLNLFVVPNIGSPIRNPELLSSRWWERSDIAIEFNEQVNESIEVNAVASVEVILNNEQGVIKDIIITQ